MASKTKVLQSIVEYLQSLKSEDNDDQIDTITSLIASQFDLTNESSIFEESSYYPIGLPNIFEAGVNSLKAQTYSESYANALMNSKFESFCEVVSNKGYFDGADKGSVEYLKRNAKLIKKFNEKAAKATPVVDKEGLEKQAEELKFKGNTAINAKDYNEAICLYTEALALSSDGPNSHVYYSNRAAAYCHLNQYAEAVDDCESCISLSPDYVKAHSRLGLANFFLERYEDAVAAYEKAVELEPHNQSSIDSLNKARTKLKKLSNKNNNDVLNSLPGGGIPPGMMNNPAMKQAMDQMGGSAGLANLMKDPKMMAMAQQMMKDPKMMQQAMSMLGGNGAGGGGMDMSALSSMMGGGLDNNTTDVPSSSSSSAKKQFKGFED